ncbi:MAG: hypothetical protein JWN83_2589 [Chitinophagaceae bacterium]|nr:hypothetical protein [Chitinophagaceae bacterium]
MIIKGIPLYILKYLSQHENSSRNSFGTIHHHIPVKSRAEFDQAIKGLYEDGYIDITTEGNFDIYQIKDKGREYISEYDDYAITDVFNGNYDFAILKFLYDMDEPVPTNFFPESILSHAPRDGKGMNDSVALRTYIDYQSSIDKYVKVIDNNKYQINQLGIKYYDHLVGMDSKETQIEFKPLIHIDNSTHDYSTHTVGSDNLVTTHSELEKVQQSTGSETIQKLNDIPSSKSSLIKKIIIGVIVGLLVILIGHYVFNIG